MPIDYRHCAPTAEELIDLYRACTLGARRPLGKPGAAATMLARSNLVISAWDGPLLVGLLRGWSDAVLTTYVNDLAVRESHQRHGIGRRLLREAKAMEPDAMLVLLAAPQAHEYYGRIGFAQHRSAWVLRPDMAL